MDSKVEVSVTGGGQFTCTTDGEGVCKIPLDGELQVHLFEYPRAAFIVHSEESSGAGTFADAGDRLFDQALKKYNMAKARAAGEKAEQLAERRLKGFLEIVEETRLVCSKSRPSLEQLRKSMMKMKDTARTLGALGAGTGVAKDAFVKVWKKCLTHSKRLMKTADRFVKKHRYKEAAPYFQFIKEIDPERAGEADSKLAGCQRVFRMYRPERIKDTVAYAEGDGVVSYFSLVNSDDEYTAADGRATLIMASTNNDRPTQKCFMQTWEVSEDDFEVFAVGQGMLARKVLGYRLPFVKWSKMTCSMVQSYYRLDGLSGLKSWEWKYGMVAEVEFRTTEGEVLRGLDSFRP